MEKRFSCKICGKNVTIADVSLHKWKKYRCYKCYNIKKSKSTRKTIPIKLRKKLLTDANNRCSKCYKQHKKLEIHHKNKCNYDNNLNNLCVLCINCHIKEHIGENVVNLMLKKLRA